MKNHTGYIIMILLVIFSRSTYAETQCGSISVMQMEKMSLAFGGQPLSVDKVDEDIKLLQRIIKTGNDGKNGHYTKEERAACKIQLAETQEFRKQKIDASNNPASQPSTPNSQTRTWGLGDAAYIFNADNGGQKIFAEISIEDIRGQKVYIKVRNNCQRTLYQGDYCGRYDFSITQYKMGEFYWVNQSDLTDSWKDKL